MVKESRQHHAGRWVSIENEHGNRRGAEQTENARRSPRGCMAESKIRAPEHGDFQGRAGTQS